MSSMRRKDRVALNARASVFAALGDATRLTLLAKLSKGEPHSISRLTEGTKLTRQAVTKHLRVLEVAGVVHSLRVGRESLFAFKPEPIEDIRAFLDVVSVEWDHTLLRLKDFVEVES